MAFLSGNLICMFRFSAISTESIALKTGDMKPRILLCAWRVVFPTKMVMSLSSNGEVNLAIGVLVKIQGQFVKLFLVNKTETFMHCFDIRDLLSEILSGKNGCFKMKIV